MASDKKKKKKAKAKSPCVHIDIDIDDGDVEYQKDDERPEDGEHQEDDERPEYVERPVYIEHEEAVEHSERTFVTPLIEESSVEPYWQKGISPTRKHDAHEAAETHGLSSAYRSTGQDNAIVNPKHSSARHDSSTPEMRYFQDYQDQRDPYPPYESQYYDQVDSRDVNRNQTLNQRQAPITANSDSMTPTDARAQLPSQQMAMPPYDPAYVQWCQQQYYQGGYGMPYPNGAPAAWDAPSPYGNPMMPVYSPHEFAPLQGYGYGPNAYGAPPMPGWEYSPNLYAAPESAYPAQALPPYQPQYGAYDPYAGMSAGEPYSTQALPPYQPQYGVYDPSAGESYPAQGMPGPYDYDYAESNNPTPYNPYDWQSPSAPDMSGYPPPAGIEDDPFGPAPAQEENATLTNTEDFASCATMPEPAQVEEAVPSVGSDVPGATEPMPPVYSTAPSSTESTPTPVQIEEVPSANTEDFAAKPAHAQEDDAPLVGTAAPESTEPTSMPAHAKKELVPSAGSDAPEPSKLCEGHAEPLGNPVLDERAIAESPLFNEESMSIEDRMQGSEDEHRKHMKTASIALAVSVAIVIIVVAIILGFTLSGGSSGGESDASTSSSSSSSFSSSSNKSKAGYTSYQYTVNTVEGVDYNCKETVTFDPDGNCERTTMEMSFPDAENAGAYVDSLADDYRSNFTLDSLNGSQAKATIDISGLCLDRAQYENALRASAKDVVILE